MIYVLIALAVVLIGFGIGAWIYKKSKYYPQKLIKMDISKEKNMDNSVFLDYFLENCDREELLNHIQKIDDWKNQKILSFGENIKKIDRFLARCDKIDYKAFTIQGYRIKTKYVQLKYSKTYYKGEVVTNELHFSDSKLKKLLDERTEENNEEQHNLGEK